jgi:hypothetical protein
MLDVSVGGWLGGRGGDDVTRHACGNRHACGRAHMWQETGHARTFTHIHKRSFDTYHNVSTMPKHEPSAIFLANVVP